MSIVFRGEAVKHAARRLEGEILLSAPRAMLAASAAVIALFLLAIFALFEVRVTDRLDAFVYIDSHESKILSATDGPNSTSRKHPVIDIKFFVPPQDALLLKRGQRVELALATTPGADRVVAQGFLTSLSFNRPTTENWTAPEGSANPTGVTAAVKLTQTPSFEAIKLLNARQTTVIARIETLRGSIFSGFVAKLRGNGS